MSYYAINTKNPAEIDRFIGYCALTHDAVAEVTDEVDMGPGGPFWTPLKIEPNVELTSQSIWPDFDFSVIKINGGSFFTVRNEDDDIPARKAEAIVNIKKRAGEIILARLPQWKQANLTARAVELQMTAQAVWTQAEADEFAAIVSEWDWVKSVRGQSDVAVSAISDSAVTTAAQVTAIEQNAFT